MSYGNRKLSLGGQDNGLARLVFDSGSSYTYFTKQVYSDLLVAVSILQTSNRISHESLHLCYSHYVKCLISIDYSLEMFLAKVSSRIRPTLHYLFVGDLNSQ